MILFTLILLVSSCVNNTNNENAETGKQKQKLDNEALRSYVQEKGAMIASSSQKALGSQLKKAMLEGGVSNAIKYCNVNAYSLIDSLEESYGVTIKRATHKIRNPEDAPDKHEKDILRTYLDQMDTDETLDPMVKSISDKKMLYAKPIMLNKPLCLNCHGQVGQELSKKDFALLQEKYPNDSAYNHKLGDLRGIWSIKFTQKQIVKNIQQNDSGS